MTQPIHDMSDQPAPGETAPWMLRISATLIQGWLQPAKRAPGCGFFNLGDRLTKRYGRENPVTRISEVIVPVDDQTNRAGEKVIDASKATMKTQFTRADYYRQSILTWNGDMEEEAAAIRAFQPDIVLVKFYSWGFWGFMNLCAALAALAALSDQQDAGDEANKEREIAIDLASAYDPVPRIVNKPISRIFTAITPSNKPLVLPAIVRTAALWRTVYKPSFSTPWGRDIELESGGQIVGKTVYGRTQDFKKYDPPSTERVVTDEATHTTIDELEHSQDQDLQITDLFVESRRQS